MLVTAREGDILLFYANPTFEQELIELGERLEDGPQPRMYYHCAVATGERRKIEALSRVYETSISYDGSFDVFRPSIPLVNVRKGLRYLRGLLGERYDWLLIVDDGLRYLTQSIVHLPKRMVLNNERQRKICSSLVADYLDKAGFRCGLKTYAIPSPQDLAIALQPYQVTG